MLHTNPDQGRDAQRIHGVCSTAKGILRLQMQAASLPGLMLCNPGKRFPEFYELVK